MKNKKFWYSIIVFMGGQAFLYAFLKLFQSNYHVINFSLDNKIPFLGHFIYIYNIFYPFTFICLYYMFKKDMKNYYKMILSGTLGVMVCYIIFLLYPTVMIRPDITGYSGLTKLVLNITYKLDNPALNCFPSIHCLFAFTMMFGTVISKKTNVKVETSVSIVSILIVLSTLFVKQHYIYDAVGALVITSACFYIVYKTALFDKYIKRVL